MDIGMALAWCGHGQPAIMVPNPELFLNPDDPPDGPCDASHSSSCFFLLFSFLESEGAKALQ